MANIVYKAEGYRPMPESYSPPRKKVDINVIKTDMEAYNKLKTRIVLNSLKFGAVGPWSYISG